jgi:hypothetical protein
VSLRGARGVALGPALRCSFDEREALCHCERVMAKKSDLKCWNTTTFVVVHQHVPCDYRRPVGMVS